jgi:NADH-quinone oxidoreductase subunit M
MRFLNQWLLTVLLLLPLLGAVAVMTLRHKPLALRRTALGATLAACAVSVLIFLPFRWRHMLTYDEGPRGSVRLSQKIPLAAGAEYHVAVDGLSIPFVLLTTLLFALLCAAGWNDASKGPAYFITLLVLEFATLGTFVCFDLLFLVVLMVLTAAAAVVLSRISAEDGLTPRAASIYLAVSAVCLVVAVFPLRSGAGSFDLIRLAQPIVSPRAAPAWPVIILALGLLIRTAAFPVHTWLVISLQKPGYPGSLVLTSVVPLTGAYGLLRIALPLSTRLGTGALTAFAVLGLIGFVFGGLCAMAADRLRTFVAYSSVSVMGCVVFALGLANPTALDGAVMLLLGHALVSATMLLLAELAPPSPANDRVPVWNAFFALAWIAWLVAPVLGGLVVITLAGFESARSSPSVGSYLRAVIAILGVLVGAIAAAQVARTTFMPAPQSESEIQRRDVTPVDVTVLSILTGVALLLGLLPGFLCYSFTHPAARALLHAD